VLDHESHQADDQHDENGLNDASDDKCEHKICVLGLVFCV
jgi:hypothetical protein